MMDSRAMRRWLERMTRLQGETAKLRRRGYELAFLEEHNAPMLSYRTRAEVERLCASLNRQWRKP